MPSQSENFDRDQALLLMYLADELSPRDRAQVAQRLACEPLLREALAKLTEAHEFSISAMVALDAGTSPPVPDHAAELRATNLIRKWAARRRSEPPAPAKHSHLSLPWWCYPAATAAMLLIAVIIYGVDHEWYLKANMPTDNGRQFTVAPPEPDDTTPAAAIAEMPDAQQQELLDAFGRSAEPGQNDAPLEEADRTVNSVHDSEDLESVFSSLTVDSINQEQTP